MPPHEGRSLARPAAVVAVLLALAALPFLPLGAAALEETCFGSNYVEDLFRAMGVHDDLGKLYDAVGVN